MFSPRILGEEIEPFKLGDYVRYEGKYGVIIDISGQDQGNYKIQKESGWVYNNGVQAETDTVHCSKIERVDKPKQDRVGEIIFCLDPHGSKDTCKCIGEVVFELHDYFIVKVPSFRGVPLFNKRGGYYSYSSYYVENGDGFIYMTARKEDCRYLKNNYLFWYEEFRRQSEQME